MSTRSIYILILDIISVIYGKFTLAKTATERSRDYRKNHAKDPDSIQKNKDKCKRYRAAADKKKLNEQAKIRMRRKRARDKMAKAMMYAATFSAWENPVTSTSTHPYNTKHA